MDIFFTGDLSGITSDVLASFPSDIKCVLYSETAQPEIKRRNAIVYNNVDAANDTERLFGTFSFEHVIYNSRTLSGKIQIFDEIEKLEKTLFLAQKNGVKNFTYVLSNDVQKDHIHKQDAGSREVFFQACEEMCQKMTEQKDMHIVILRVPFVYSMQAKTGKIKEFLQDAVEKKEIHLVGEPAAQTDFLCYEDLGILLSRIVDEPVQEGYTAVDLSGGDPMTFERLSTILEVQMPQTKIIYDNQTRAVPIYLKDNWAQKEYEWVPEHSFEKDLPQLIEQAKKRYSEQQKKKEKISVYQNVKDKVRIMIEIVVTFAVAVLLDYWTKGNVQLQFLDFKMIFVVLMGTMNGLASGVVAAVLSCVAYVVLESTSTPWQILFYNVQNWLPFATYFLLGAVTGYTRDRHTDMIRFVRDEYDILSEKYIFLNELYVKLLENKQKFNSQIIGYRDSFGKIYAIVKKLDTLSTDDINMEAIDALEDIMENKSIAIYTVASVDGYGRLNACSGDISTKISKSIKLNEYPALQQSLGNAEMFVNTECLADYPDYMTPIVEKNHIYGMIVVWYAKDGQMDLEYKNKFSIVSDLIKTAVIKALNSENVEKNYISGTQVLTHPSYAEALEAKNRMEKKSYVEYAVIAILMPYKDALAKSESIQKLIRQTDQMGLDEQNRLCIILNQTDRKGIAMVSQRLQEKGIPFEMVKSL